MKTAVETKDLIWQMIRNADGADGAIGLCRVGDTVLNILTVTEGMWEELEYSYKAREIANHLATRAWELGETCQHAQTHKALVQMLDHALQVSKRFNDLQMARMHPQHVLNWNSKKMPVTALEHAN